MKIRISKQLSVIIKRRLTIVRNKNQMRRSQSMDLDDHDHPSESEEYQPKVFKLLSETDIQVKFQYGLIC